MWVGQPVDVAGAVRGDPPPTVYYRGYDWVVADERCDGNHVHVTLTAPKIAQYRPTTNDG